MALNANSIAAAVGVGVENVQFTPTAEVLPRRLLIIGEFDADNKPDIEFYKLYLVTSPEDVGDRFGFGFPLHRLTTWAFLGSQGIETWVVPLQEEGADGPGGVQATGSLAFTVSSLKAGTVYLYISGERLTLSVSASDTATNIASSLSTLINNDETLPITASPSSGTINITAKAESEWGNDVSLTFNWGLGEELPSGLSVVVTDMSGGNGIDSVDNALDALGINDDRNERYFTDIIMPYAIPRTNHMDDLSTWNGVGNDFVGNYDKIVQRPVRSLTGDVTAGTSGLNALIAITDARKLDRTNGVIAVPGSPNHPSEIAALTVGIMARINNNNAAESYVDLVLSEIIPGIPSDRWTADYNVRDTAVKNGISPIKVEDDAVFLQNIMSFYRPSNVPPSSNGYRSQRNLSVMQNITNSVKVNFDQDKWKRITIVADVTKVTNAIARQRVKDVIAVQNDVIALARAWEGLGWIFSASFTMDEIKKGTYIEIRSGGSGFNINIPIVLSGESWVLDNVVLFDTALTVFTQ